MISFLQPDWPAPDKVRAFTTLRSGGVSIAPFDQFNLADHVGDNTQCVLKNRSLLTTRLALPSEPIWLNQTHSTSVLQAFPENRFKEGDASYSFFHNQVCIVLTADCLPILLCNKEGNYISAIHAGWRGLAHGIIEKTIECSANNPDQLMAWLGPAIGPLAFEIGPEVQNSFVKQNPLLETAFFPSINDRFLANIYTIARVLLNAVGIHHIYGGTECTYSNIDHFYSYRRDKKTGRMATLIWLSDSATS